ncbi:MAG TPA: sulfurtransferase [Steroidobacteraceae bacterium]|nr:sulfurtransferase [Steroidobacteraceae bacterium]
MYTTLIEPVELVAQIANPDWTVIDCRFELTRPQWGAEVYAAGHIPGAIYAHLDRDLSGPVTPASGRHPLPDIGAFTEKLGAWGIDAGVQVVAYDQGNGAYAARLWWLLHWLGHEATAVLDGGFAAWQQAALPQGAEPPPKRPRRFVPRPAESLVVSTAELSQWVSGGELTRGTRTLVDARGADRFAGHNETLDPVAGHVPGAESHPFAGNLDEHGRFLPAPELRARWLRTLGTQSPSQVISMCGSGVTACHNLLALQVAGLPGARLYAGSWSEWIRDSSRPVEPPRQSSSP